MDRDPFNDLVREFFSGSRNLREEEVSNIDEDEMEYAEDKENIYLTFYLSGFSEKDINLNISEKEIKIFAEMKKVIGVQEYLVKKLSKGLEIVREIPRIVRGKKYTYTLRNGVLEVVFRR